MSRAVPRIETARLVLRPPGREDFDACAASMADAESTRVLGGTQPRATAWRSFRSVAGAWGSPGGGRVSVRGRGA